MIDYQPTKKMLQNKTILVTGAGDGIGKEAAKQFAHYGATVILIGRTQKKLESVYDEIVNASYPEPFILTLDFKQTSADYYQDLATSIEEQFGCIEGVLHNASVLGQLSPFADIKDEEFQEVMQVNLHSQFFMTKALLPLLLKAKRASVVFTSSSVGAKGRAFWGSYSISKFATEGMMQVLADEYENSTIRFNCINPGGTRTSMRAKAFPGEDPNTLKTPADLMPLYLYLMADDSKAENGKTFVAQPK